MGDTLERAIRSELSFLEDNCYRFELAEKARPGSKTASGQLYSEVIANHKQQIAELQEALCRIKP